eukprot:tig00001126_g7115.t1
MSGSKRFVALIDLDCFFVQVARAEDPSLVGVPCAVDQFWELISVSYEARALGVKKHMIPDEALRQCPSLRIVDVHLERGKVCYRRYMEISERVVAALRSAAGPGVQLEKASIDECYLDFTAALEHGPEAQLEADTPALESTVFAGDGAADARLRQAAALLARLREAVRRETGLEASGGVGPNKLVAKLAAGANKPQRQTARPLCPGGAGRAERGTVARVGPALRTALEAAGLCTAADLRLLSPEELQRRFGLTDRLAEKLAEYRWGRDPAPVAEKPPPERVQSQMSLRPYAIASKQAVDSAERLEPFLATVAADLADRLRADCASIEAPTWVRRYGPRDPSSPSGPGPPPPPPPVHTASGPAMCAAALRAVRSLLGPHRAPVARVALAATGFAPFNPSATIAGFLARAAPPASPVSPSASHRAPAEAPDAPRPPASSAFLSGAPASHPPPPASTSTSPGGRPRGACGGVGGEEGGGAGDGKAGEGGEGEGPGIEVWAGPASPSSEEGAVAARFAPDDLELDPDEPAPAAPG